MTQVFLTWPTENPALCAGTEPRLAAFLNPTRPYSLINHKNSDKSLLKTLYKDVTLMCNLQDTYNIE